MKQWRRRGFVQDSEDEGESSGKSQSPSPRKNRRRAANERPAPTRTPIDAIEKRKVLLSTTAVGSGGTGEHGTASRRRRKEAAETGRAVVDHTSKDELPEDELPLNGDVCRRPGVSLVDVGTKPRQPMVHVNNDDFVRQSFSPAHDIAKARDEDDLTNSRVDARLMHSALASSAPILNDSPSATNLASCSRLQYERMAYGADELLHNWAPRRNFRQRKAIQLHPYLILDGRYQNDMREAGLMPTRLIRPPSIQQRNVRNGGSDSESDRDSQSAFRSSPAQSPKSARPHTSSEERRVPTETLGQHATNDSSPPSHTGLDDDDLPALGDLLSHKNHGETMYVGSKRRKLLHVAQRIGFPQYVQQNGDLSTENNMSVDDRPSSVEAPLSPISSLRASPDLPHLVGRGGFRFPVGFSPQKPPTPATSSSGNAIRRKPAVNRSVESSPAPQFPRPRPIDLPQAVDLTMVEDETSSDSTTESSTSSSGDKNDSGHLKVIQRRIKGVLPASWLKLDVKAQGTVPSNKAVQRHQHDLRDDLQQPGVARKRLRPSNASRSIRDILAISSGEESEAGTEGPNRPKSEAQMTLAHPEQHSSISFIVPDDDPGEYMEDNTVDSMLPSVPRGKRYGNHFQRKRQTKLVDTFDHTTTKRPRTHHAQQAQARWNSKSVATAGASTQARFVPPRLSVLDAMSLSPTHSGSVPTFLKVARRQAKRLPDQARHGPAQKNIRLQTRADTADVRSVLADWRAGKIQQKHQAKPKPILPTKRRALAPRNTNTTQPRLGFDAADVLWRDKGPQAQVPQSYSRSGSVVVSDMQQPRLSRQVHRVPKGINLQNGPRLHDGQLEVEADSVILIQDRMRFSRSVQGADGGYVQSRKEAPQRMPSTLTELEAQIKHWPSAQKPLSEARHAMAEGAPLPCRVRHRRLRKTIPQRIDVETVVYRQPEEFILPTHGRSSNVQCVEQSSEVLQDLHPWGVPYTLNFDISPLPADTYFHNSTFVGSGDFRKASNITKRNLDVELGTHIVLLAGRQCRWGSWNEELSSDVKSILTQFTQDVRSMSSEQIQQDSQSSCIGNFIPAIETLLNANSDWLSFSDPIDRAAFALAYLNVLEELHTILEERKTQDLQSTERDLPQTLLRLIVRLTVLTAQILAILKDLVTSSELIARSGMLFKRQTDLVIWYLIRRGLDEIRGFYDENQRHSVRETGIKESQVAVEAVVVLVHLLEGTAIPGLSFWDALNAQLLPSVDTATETGLLEHKWLGIFTVLPLLEIDSGGLHRAGHRSDTAPDNWEAVKSLLSRAFALYQNTALVSGSTVNEYLRALLTRCHHLIRAWAWRKCETVISAIFDFFANREYRSLHKEDKHGSPRFLEQLANRPALNFLRDEKAFHLFVKIIATGLFEMRKVYDNKQIRSVVWRWMPNHNRTFYKDKDLRKEDLDALRNQHDLLSTLYWASPASIRPRLELIQNLVDHSASHLEACRINIKACSNLVAFQLSTDEPAQAADPFASWLKDILQRNVSQYKLARPELEAQCEAARQEGGLAVSIEQLETMVSRNQNGIVAALGEAIAGLRSAIRTAENLPAAWTLLRDSNVQVIFALFDSKKKKVNSVLIEALSTFDAFLDLVDRQPLTAESQKTTEESQDYGDWPEEDDAVLTKGPGDQALDLIHEQTASLLSNIFGSESSPDDELLTRTVEHWARLAAMLVRRKIADFETFVGDYGRHAWSQLRNTDQRRRYAPYFLSCLQRHNSSVVKQHREQYVLAWMCSLVERDEQLKYQHALTSDLLNTSPDDPLLKNLPFMRDATIGRYDISIQELRERRLSLLSSVLSNMHDEFQRTLQHDPSSIRTLRTEYTSLLNHLTLQMRRNYEELRQGEIVTGSYVKFVQSMIEFMQQYTTDICPVDKYFTDSAAFPLPAMDPTYLVGRLRSYGSKLDDSKTVKQLIMFVHTISERAALDNEQNYLIAQLTAALDGPFEHENLGRPSLRSVLVRVIFPAYLEASLDGSPAWILMQPLIRVCNSIFRDLLHKFSATNATSVQAVTVMLAAILSSLMKAVTSLEFASYLFQQPHILSTLSLMFDFATVCVPPLDYIRRRNGLGASAAEAMSYLRDFTLYAGKNLLGRSDAFPPTNLGNGSAADMRTAELMAFCSQKLQEDLRNKWKTEDGRHLVKRGIVWRELQVSVGSLDEEKAMLIWKIEAFHEALDRAKSL